MSVIERGCSMRLLTEVYDEIRSDIPTDVLGEMAFPSYLHGNGLSRWAAWSKVRVISRVVRPSAGMRILDFGCGSGVLWPMLARSQCEVVGVDQELRPARRMAEKLSPARIELLEADGWQKRVSSGSMDTVIAANVLEHVSDVNQLLAQFAEKLTADGRLVISGPTENWLYRMGRRALQVLGHAEFTGDYHHTQIVAIITSARHLGYQLQELWFAPLPWRPALYQIAVLSRPT